VNRVSKSKNTSASPRLDPLGRMAVFLLPSLKLKSRQHRGQSYDDIVHHFLMKHFGGYTASAGNIFGFWRDEPSGREFYGEHREYKVSFRGRDRVAMLQKFLSKLAAELGEETIYMEYGEDAWLVHARSADR
jgi:hypothetical protein